MNDVNDALALFIKNKKLDSGMTYTAFAQIANVSHETITRFIRRRVTDGKRVGLRVDSADRLLTALGTNWLEFAKYYEEVKSCKSED